MNTVTYRLYADETLVSEDLSISVEKYPPNNNNLTIKMYTVWVGAVEVNDYLLNLRDAKLLANEYIDNDYDDVVIEFIEDHADEV